MGGSGLSGAAEGAKEVVLLRLMDLGTGAGLGDLILCPMLFILSSTIGRSLIGTAE